MNSETIFYSFQIHDKFTPGGQEGSSPPVISPLIQIKEEIINLLKSNGIPTFEVIRPEIYKHEISFTFLPNFSPGVIHLIFKPPFYIRPLKKAHNILILSGPSYNMKDQAFHNQHPFSNLTRMLSLVDEIWVRAEADRQWLKAQNFSRKVLFLQEGNRKGVSSNIILERIRKSQGA